MEAVWAAREALARADTDAAYRMKQYRRCVEEVREWVAAAPLEEPDTTPRYRLLQQTLQDTIRSRLRHSRRRRGATGAGQRATILSKREDQHSSDGRGHSVRSSSSSFHDSSS